jgi:superfamily II DNA or RNA helicase
MAKKKKLKIFEIFDRLYPYQKDAVLKAVDNDKGIICMPTGVGKTFVSASIIADDIIKHSGFRMYVVNAPRIVLTYQLLKEVYGFLADAKIESRYMFVHSGGKTDERELEDIRIKANLDGANIPFSEIRSGTSTKEIREMIEKAKTQDLPLIFFSTYNSAERIEEARKGFDPFSIVLNDEAHYLVQEQFHDILHTLQSKRCYFFTATTISTPSDKGRGMNNKDLYGEVLYTMTPRQAIDLGKMVRPRLHFVTTVGVYTTADYNKSLNKIIKDTFEQHSRVLVKTLPKVLVSVKGTQDIVNFLNSKEYKKLRSSDVDVYAISSNSKIGNNINGDRVDRGEFLKRLKAGGADATKKIIVLHYDILAEGIDVSGFSGIMPLRNLSKSKFLQTFGRAARPDSEDRKRIDSKKIGVNDLDKMNKPYSYIMIPCVYSGNTDDKANIVKLVREIRGYGFSPNEFIVGVDRIHGIPETEQPIPLNELKKNFPSVGKIIEEIIAEIEAEEQAKLTKIDLLKKDFNL